MQDNERRLQLDMLPQATKIIIGFAADQEIGKSKAAMQFIQKAVDCMPEEIKKKYLSIYNKLTPEERGCPTKFQNRI